MSPHIGGVWGVSSGTLELPVGSWRGPALRFGFNIPDGLTLTVHRPIRLAPNLVADSAAIPDGAPLLTWEVTELPIAVTFANEHKRYRNPAAVNSGYPRFRGSEWTVVFTPEEAAFPHWIGFSTMREQLYDADILSAREHCLSHLIYRDLYLGNTSRTHATEVALTAPTYVLRMLTRLPGIDPEVAATAALRL